ncbi:MAG TPA: SDR family NAD(P)-dependent oxidoreductase [Chitinophagaceae bacterium]|jgi:short-subunit dehydrogenase|nr:SDR family NAD(P)-dependent oxidoreductase [Chitinophagaceae bacterium]
MNSSSRKIIIIGASSGIGRKLAECYAEKGDLVGITGRRGNLLEEIQAKYPGKIYTSCFDVTGNENIQHITSLVQQLGGLDILIISAGTGDPTTDLNWEIDKTTVATNVDGFVEIANWAFNYFIQQKEGRLVTISSVGANRGGSHAPAYNASKAFQSTYFYGLSLKAAKMKSDIGITCIEPGFLATKMAKSDKVFWVVPLDKAARQIMQAIDRKKRKAYISKRWWIIAQMLRWMPHWLYRRVA